MILTYQIVQSEPVKTFLKNQDYSKRTLSAIKLNGALLLNGSPVTVRHVMNKGDRLEVHFPCETPSENLIPYDKELEIIYEDAYLIIVNKPQMQNCAPSREHPHGSLVEQVLAYYTKKGEKINPHIVTRLDRNTSGLVVFAKFGHVHHLFSKVKFKKEYVALAYGQTQSSGVIEAPIARRSDSIIKREVNDKGKYAKTVYQRLMQNETASLCKIKLLTGRTHQIRVHFEYIGHPLIGDDLYGGNHPCVHGQALHCCSVEFIHPIYRSHYLINVDYKQLIKLFNMV